jgi:DNA polymerase-1
MERDLFTEQENNNYRAIKSEQLQWLLNRLKEAEHIAVSLETKGTPILGRIVGIALAVNPGEAYYLPLRHSWGKNVTPEEARIFLQPIFKRERCLTYNFKDVYSYLKRFRLEINVFADVMLLAYVDEVNQDLGIKALAKNYLGIDLVEFKDLFTGKRKERRPNFWDFLPEDVCEYACTKADIVFSLYQHLKEKDLEQNQVYKLEMDLIRPVAKMEERGIQVDRRCLVEIKSSLDSSITRAKREIFELVGKEVELNSTRQVSRLLYNDLHLPYQGFYTKSGFPSVSTFSLEGLMDRHLLVPKIVTHRKMVKLKGMIETFIQFIDSDNIIHTSFLPQGVVSGRFASENPNLQNVPGSDVWDIKGAFRPREGFYFASADYKQIEYRIIAGEAGEESLIEAFRRGEDVHLRTASLMFNLPIEEVDEKQRAIAKQAGFALIYGMSAHGLARRLKVKPEEAKALLESYFKSIPKIKKWIDNVKKEVRRTGYVTTRFGRRRNIPEVFSKVRSIKAFGFRSAVNHIAQATCADILKMAMVRLEKALRFYDVHPLVSIHDQIIFEVNKVLNQEEVVQAIKKAMEIEIEGYPPIDVGITIGESWRDLNDKEYGRFGQGS